MTNPDNPAPTTDAPTDWSAIEEEILCPLCEYSLRTLTTPRCPECGYRFTWPEVLDPNRRLHPYLFEHHPERNIKSFWQTAVGTWRPNRFWTSLHPVQPSRPRRLIAYWLIGAGIYVLALTALILLAALTEMHWLNQPAPMQLASVTRPPPQVTIRQALRLIVLDQDLLLVTGLLAVIPLGWTWLTFLALMIFRISMRRARVRTDHVLRCAIYSYDQAFWIGLGLGAVVGVAIAFAASADFYLPEMLVSLATLTWLLAALICGLRLWRAYASYLRFDRPFWTVFAAQFIVGLAMLKVVLLVALRG
jgi:hypothetical protein